MNTHLVLMLAFAVAALNAQRSAVKFPPERVEDLISHSVCELPSESEVGMYRVPLTTPGYRLEYRKRWKVEVVLLVEMNQAEDTCRDRIVGVLKVPAHGTREAVNFECSSKAAAAAKGTFVGIMPNDERSAIAVPAWRVDTRAKTFELVTDRSVVCSNTPVDR